MAVRLKPVGGSRRETITERFLHRLWCSDCCRYHAPKHYGPVRVLVVTFEFIALFTPASYICLDETNACVRLTCPSEVSLDHVKPFLNPALHAINVAQHDSQRAVHALQFVHQVSVVLRGLVLVLQKL